MTLYLDMLRHGETEAGTGFHGSSDHPLTTTGRQQMQLALAGQGGWDLIVSSPLLRCCEFAYELSAIHGVPVVIAEDLRELHFGDWEGRNSAEILLEDPMGLGQFWNTPYQYTPPGGEPVSAFAARVRSAIERLQAEQDGKRVLLISHGGVMRLLLAQARQLPDNQLLQVEVAHGGLHRLEVGPALALCER